MPDSVSDPASGSTPVAEQPRPEWRRLADDTLHPLRQLGRYGGPRLEPMDPAEAASQREWRWYHSREAWMALAMCALTIALIVVFLVVQPWRNFADEIAGVPHNVWRLTHPDTWGQR
jgi:hypothetical protein